MRSQSGDAAWPGCLHHHPIMSPPLAACRKLVRLKLDGLRCREECLRCSAVGMPIIFFSLAVKPLAVPPAGEICPGTPWPLILLYLVRTFEVVA